MVNNAPQNCGNLGYLHSGDFVMECVGHFKMSPIMSFTQLITSPFKPIVPALREWHDARADMQGQSFTFPAPFNVGFLPADNKYYRVDGSFSQNSWKISVRLLELRHDHFEEVLDGSIKVPGTNNYSFTNVEMLAFVKKIQFDQRLSAGGQKLAAHKWGILQSAVGDWEEPGATIPVINLGRLRLHDLHA